MEAEEGERGGGAGFSRMWEGERGKSAESWNFRWYGRGGGKGRGKGADEGSRRYARPRERARDGDGTARIERKVGSRARDGDGRGREMGGTRDTDDAPVQSCRGCRQKAESSCEGRKPSSSSCRMEMYRTLNRFPPAFVRRRISRSAWCTQSPLLRLPLTSFILLLFVIFAATTTRVHANGPSPQEGDRLDQLITTPDLGGTPNVTETCNGFVEVDYGASAVFNISMLEASSPNVTVPGLVGQDSLLFVGSVNIHNLDQDSVITDWDLSWTFDGASERIVNYYNAELADNVPTIGVPGTQVTFTDLGDARRTGIQPGTSTYFNFFGESAPDSPHVRLPFDVRFNGFPCQPIQPKPPNNETLRRDEESQVEGNNFPVLLLPASSPELPYNFTEDEVQAQYIQPNSSIVVRLLPIEFFASSPLTSPATYWSTFITDIESYDESAMLKDVAFQYWFSGAFGRPSPNLYKFVCYSADIGCENIIGEIYPGVDTIPGAELVLQVSFKNTSEFAPTPENNFFFGSVSDAVGATGSMTLGIEAKSFALEMDASDDWSNNNLSSRRGFEDNLRMPGFVNGALAWGVSPLSIEPSNSTVDGFEPHLEARCTPLDEDQWHCNLFAIFCCRDPDNLAVDGTPTDNSGGGGSSNGSGGGDGDSNTVDRNESGNSGDSNGDAGLWIGIAIGLSVLLLLLIVVSFFLWRRRRNRKAAQVKAARSDGKSSDDPESGAPPHTLAPSSQNSIGKDGKHGRNGPVLVTVPSGGISTSPLLGSRSGMFTANGMTYDEVPITIKDNRDASKEGGLLTGGSILTAAQIAAGLQHEISGGIKTIKIEAPVDRDTPITGNLAVDFNNEVILESLIGNGAFGSVYKGNWNGRAVAVKLMASQGNSLIESFHAEVDVLSRLNHPNIVQFLGASIVPPHLCIVEELVERGSLWTLLHSPVEDMEPPPRPQTLLRTLELAEEIVSALAYMHPTIVHRDLKSGNILLDAEGHAKVADFGIARFKNNTYMSTIGGGAGTAAYMAPELFSAGKIDEKSDMFSLGVLLWEIYLGKIPWEDCTHPMQVVMAVGINGERLPLPDDMPKGLASIINKCWRDDSHRRPSSGELVRIIQKERRYMLHGTPSSSREGLHSASISQRIFSPSSVLSEISSSSGPSTDESSDKSDGSPGVSGPTSDDMPSDSIWDGVGELPADLDDLDGEKEFHEVPGDLKGRAEIKNENGTEWHTATTTL